MLFSILFVSFAKSAIMNSTHSFTGSSNLTNLYIPPQETPPSYLDSTPILGYQNLKKRTNKKRIKRDTDLQTSQVKCEAVNEENINPNDMMPSECVCQELLINLCLRIIKKLNYDLLNPFFSKNMVKLSEDTFTDYVEKFIDKENFTNNAYVVTDYNRLLAMKTWFSIYLLSNKNFYSKKPRTIKNLQKNFINSIKIETYEDENYRHFTNFYFDNIKYILTSIEEKFQLNNNNTCTLRKTISEELNWLDDEEKLFIERKRKNRENCRKNYCWLLGFLLFGTIFNILFIIYKCCKTYLWNIYFKIKSVCFIQKNNQQDNEDELNP